MTTTSIIKEYSEKNFCIFTFTGITTQINDKGEEKKKPIGMPNWKDINNDNFNDYCHPNSFGLAILTGELSHITVIDFDNIDSYNQMVLDYPELLKYKTIKTKKGVHIYCKYDKNINTTTKALNNYADVDIRNDNAIVFAPPTKYKLQNGEFCNYTDIGGDILPVPKIIMENLKQFQNKPLQSIKVKVKTYPVKEQADDETDSKNSDTDKLTKEQELLRLIKIEKKDRIWLTICSCIKNIGMSKNDWLEFCEDNELYMDKEKLELFDKIKTDKQLEIYFLQGLAKKGNPDGYREWINKYYSDLYSPLFTSALIADFFIQKYPNKFLCNDEKVYFFNGIYWEKDDKKLSNLHKFVDKTFYFDLVEYANEMLSFYNSKLGGTDDETVKNKIEKVTKLLGNINSIRKGSVRTAIIEDIVKFISNNNIEFDNNPYLFAFKNCVYDLKQGCFVTAQPTFYITKTTGYNYEQKYDNKLETELDEIIDTIFPDKDVKEYYLSILSTGLCGLQLENLFIATGTGGNGKSLINSLLMVTLGAYAYKLPSHILLTSIKSGANPEVALMNKARVVLTQEPNQNKKICCSTLKEITGDKTLNVRDLYSSDCSIKLTNTTILEANEIPAVDEVNDAVFRRIRTIPFISRFVSQEVYDTLEDKMGVFVSNPYYKTDEFQEKYKQALFNILVKRFATFQANKYVLPNQPKKCIDKSSAFLATCDDIYSWFESKYEKDEDLSTSEAIPLSDIYLEFSQSVFFQNLSKNDKRKFNKKHFVAKIEENIFLRKFIKMRNQYHNKKQLNTDSLIGWKIIQDVDVDIGY